MLFSDAIEVAIGLTFVFLLMSLVMTAVTESAEALLRTRGQRLFQGVIELLADPARYGKAEAAAEALYRHPLIQGLYRGDFAAARRGRQLPSYIPARNFALALMDQVLAAKLDAAPSDASLPAAAAPAERLRLAAERIEGAPLRRAVLQAVELGGGDLEQTRKHLEAWYDSAMDRVSGWYRRRTQGFLFWSGLAASVALNVNALTVADSLSKDAALRRAIAERAGRFVAEVPRPAGGSGEAAAPPAEATGPRAAAAGAAPRGELEAINRLGLPIGWSEGAWEALLAPTKIQGWWAWLGWLQILLGFLATGLATTLGAPFWFDVLNRTMVVRATVKPHEKSPEEASQDPQDPSRAGKGDRIVAAGAAGAPAAPPPWPAGPRAEDADPVVHLLDPATRPREEDEFDPAAPAGAAVRRL